jgi:O-glycosyl hydrolase
MIAAMCVCCCFAPVAGFAQSNAKTFNIRVDVSKKYQQINGIGVNANTRSWNGDELKPALNLLLDSMHATVWRVIVETVEKWEDENDDNDPFHFNWEYYNKLYETPKFQKAWGMIRYLNSKGITDNLMINFMGPVPAWMGKKTVKPEYQDEYVEMITSFFYYARNKKHLKFGLVSPTNESDWRNEGPELNEFAYAQLMRKLIDRMASLGMGDIRYVGPDPASMEAGIKRYIPELMKDSVIMSKLAHVGLHSYGGYYANADSALKHSKYPKSDFWITEWNAWRDGLDDGKIGVYDYTFASQCVWHLLDLLKHGATALMEWEGYDSYYEHHYPSLFSYWGILGYDHDKKTYSPRKHFYTIQQVTAFVAPGDWQVDVTGGDSLRTVAFSDAGSKKIVIVGMNAKNYPVTLEGSVKGISSFANAEIFITDSINNLREHKLVVNGGAFTTIIPPKCIFTITGGSRAAAARPQPSDWYTGDIHVHRNCGGETVLGEEMLVPMMEENDLDVIAMLADMGNGEVKESEADLKKVNGKDAPQSTANRIVHWDAEWHWDATYSNFSHQALGGHLVILGLNNAQQIWEESPYKVLQWAAKQNAIKGFCHLEYLNDSIQNELNCCIPIDFPVEAALGNIDFVAEDVYGTTSPNGGNYNSEAAINAYYKLLNCGFRLGLAAGTDYPCNESEPFGTLLTYVNVKNGLTYRKWAEGIRDGKTVVSRNGNKEFLELKVNGNAAPGDEIKLKAGKQIAIQAKWTANEAFNGTIELVVNGQVIASKKGYCAPGAPITFNTTYAINESSWICARRMDANEHLLHTAPVYVSVGGKPVRASAADADFFVAWIDNILNNIQPGGKWNHYFTKDYDAVKEHYESAKKVYQQIAAEATKSQQQPILLLSREGSFSAYTGEILKLEGFNEYDIKDADDETITSDYLNSFDVIILPHISINSTLASSLKKYVRAGGNLIAFRPAKNIADIFGLQALNDSLIDGYINIYNGLVKNPLQIHGAAIKYEIAGATTTAKLYSKQKTPTTFPAATTHKFGAGHAVALTYDLAKSICLTRQGNYLSAGEEKDGIKGIRAMDLFTNGWVDTNNNTLNQADVQMRLLSHAIETLTSEKIPLPRFWYFPDARNTLVTLTNDGEYSDEKDIDVQLADVEKEGGNMSLYILTAEKVSKASTDAWQSRGNEISGHPDDTKNAERPTWQNMNDAISNKIKELKDRYAIDSMHTIVNHWFVWCGTNENGDKDFTAQAKIERAQGIGMDINYAHYDNGSDQGHFLGSMGEKQGNYTGSGLPLKFADMNGDVVDIYQHLNNVYDQQYMEHKDSVGFFECFKGIMDHSLNDEVYSYVGVKCHNDEYFFSRGPLTKMLRYANEKQVPVWTANKLLRFLKAKDEASFSNITWSNNRLSFAITSSLSHESSLTCMVPYYQGNKRPAAVSVNNKSITFSTRKINGGNYALFTVKPGNNYNVAVQYVN